MKKIGYVLSGGGVRGYAHLGLLQYLEEINIRPYAISGTSAGAIVGVLYSAGLSPKAILDLMMKNRYFGWSTLLWNKSGFFSMDVLAKTLQSVIPANSFQSLATKLFVTATDLNNGEPVTYSTGELFQAIVASSSVPVIFEPVVLGDRILVDGGLSNNFPVEPLESICDIIIGSHVNKLVQDLKAGQKLQTIQTIERCFHLAIAQSVYSKASRCDLFLDHELAGFNMFDTKRAEEVFNIGYQGARASGKKLMSLLEN